MTNALRLSITFFCLFFGGFVTAIFVWHAPNDSPPEWFWTFLALCSALGTIFGIVHFWIESDE